MPRGITPRRPARTGRHEGTRRVTAPPNVVRRNLTKSASSHPLKNPKGGAASRPGKKNGENPTAPERVSEILKRLDHLYPDVTCALTHRNAWELVVATILSAQSTDVRVNMVTPELFRKYPAVQDFARLQPEQLELEIRSTGFFRNKSGNHGRAAYFARGRAQDGKCCPGHVVRQSRGRGGGHARSSHLAQAGADEERRSEEH
jgi:hypothetical protein